jgi:hypothetical protein
MKEEVVKKFILDVETDNHRFHTIGSDVRIINVIVPGHSQSHSNSYTISYEVYRESLLGKLTFTGFKKEKGWYISGIDITSDRMKEIETLYLSETRELKLNELLDV